MKSSIVFGGGEECKKPNVALLLVLLGLAGYGSVVLLHKVTGGKGPF